jgi:micrococcal nuclease
MTRYKKTLTGPWGLLTMAIALLVALVSVFFKPSQPVEQKYMSVRVAQVYDGDTVRLNSGEKVRLIGIDTPELHDNPKTRRDMERTGKDMATITRLGERAWHFSKSLLDGQEIKLEFDVVQRDKYGRLLAYVYLSDGRFVNEEIIKNGYAYPMTIPPNVRYADKFLALFEAAVDQKLGLWADTKPDALPKTKTRKKRRY